MKGENMKPATNLTSTQLVGKRIAFKEDDEHRTCWHFAVGLKTGKALRVALSLAEKAKIMEEGGIPAPQLREIEEEEQRVWVKADPCPSHPRGCEVAVDKECLLVSEG
jgi:hypothetical protein